MKKRIITIILIFIFLNIYSISANASDLLELEDKKENLENQQQNVKNQKEEVSAKKNDVLDEISELNSQISKYEYEIEELNDKIDNLKESIFNKEEEIKKLEEETKIRQDLLVQRLVAMYEKGQTTYLDVLLSSEDITTFISNYYRIEEIAEADQEVINSVIEKKEKIEKTKQELEKEKQEIDESKKEVEEKNNSLQIAKAMKQTKVKNLSEEEKKLQNTIDEFEAAIKEAQEEIEQARQETESSGGEYEGGLDGEMFSWPLSSSSYRYNWITSVFGYRDSPTIGASSNHGAIDIAVRYVPVLAPADGKVIIARYLSGYGNYVMIDHGDGYYTGFGHLSAFSVNQGQIVSRGQKIATSGNTGISTGAHLHYEVYIGGTDNSYRVDPLKYTSHSNLKYY